MAEREEAPGGPLLGIGRHASPAEGSCVVEFASLLAGGSFSDAPPGVSAVLAAFLRQWNDGLDDRERQALHPYAPRLLRSRADPSADDQLAWKLAEWLATTHAPRWLRCAGMEEASLRLVGAGEDPRAALEVIGDVLRRWTDAPADLHQAALAEIQLRPLLYSSAAGAAWAACREWGWQRSGTVDLAAPWMRLAWGGWLVSWRTLRLALLRGRRARAVSVAGALQRDAHRLAERLLPPP